MEFTHALHIFRLYCNRLKQDPFDAELMILTDAEKQALQELKGIIEEYSDLIVGNRGTGASKSS